MKKQSSEEILRDIEYIAKDIGEIQLMEVCGTHTVSLFRSGIKSILPDNITLLSGPGCPVCVTSQGYIDTVIDLAKNENICICTYGDMIRVPGRAGSLEEMRAQGADVKVLYSSREALKMAIDDPEKEFVWLGVGFETTAPTSAATILEAQNTELTNFSVLSGHKLAIPAMKALLSGGDIPIAGFLCPGHVSVIIGEEAYRPITDDFNKPCVIAGFEPLNMLAGIKALLQQIADGRSQVENVYGAAVTKFGNTVALDMLDRVFEVEDSVWRAIGTLPLSGLELKKKFSQFDTLQKFDLEFGDDYDPPGCRCGEVIQGKVLPTECKLFGRSCSPTQPVGPCMVSSEGTCAAWYKYGRNLDESRRRRS